MWGCARCASAVVVVAVCCAGWCVFIFFLSRTFVWFCVCVCVCCVHVVLELWAPSSFALYLAPNPFFNRFHCFILSKWHIFLCFHCKNMILPSINDCVLHVAVVVVVGFFYSLLTLFASKIQCNVWLCVHCTVNAVYDIQMYIAAIHINCWHIFNPVV